MNDRIYTLMTSTKWSRNGLRLILKQLLDEASQESELEIEQDLKNGSLEFNQKKNALPGIK